MAKKDEVHMPSVMSKKFLIADGLRVQPDAVKVFEDKLRTFAIGLSTAVGKVVISRKKKTITPEDFNGLDIVFGFDIVEDQADADEKEESEETDED